MNITLRIDIWCLLYITLFLSSGFVNSVIAQELNSILINSSINNYPSFETGAKKQVKFSEEDHVPQFFESPIAYDFGAERKERDLDYGDYQLEKDLPDSGKAGLRLFSWWKSSDGGKSKKVAHGSKINSYPTNRLLGPDATALPPGSPSPKTNVSTVRTTPASNATVSGRENAANMSTSAITSSTPPSTASTYLTTCYTITESCLPLLTLVAAPICTEGSLTSTVSSIPASTAMNATKANVTSTASGQVTQSSLNVTGTLAPKSNPGKGGASTQAVVQLAHQAIPHSVNMVNGSMVIPVYQMPSVTQIILLNTPEVTELPSIIMNEEGTESHTENVYPYSTENINIEESNVLSKNMQLKSQTQFVNTQSPFTDNQMYLPEQNYFNNALLHKIPEDKIILTQSPPNFDSSMEPHFTTANQMEHITSNLHHLSGFTNHVNQGNDIKFHSIDYVVVQKNPTREIAGIHAFSNVDIENTTSHLTRNEHLKDTSQSQVSPEQTVINNNEGRIQVNNPRNFENSIQYKNKENDIKKLVQNYNIDSKEKVEQNMQSINNISMQPEERNKLNSQNVENSKDNQLNDFNKKILGPTEENNLVYECTNDTNTISKLRNELLVLKKNPFNNSKSFQCGKLLNDPEIITNSFDGCINNNSTQNLFKQDFGNTTNYIKENNEKLSATNIPDSDKSFNNVYQIDKGNPNSLNETLKINPFNVVSQKSIHHVKSNSDTNQRNKHLIFGHKNGGPIFTSPSRVLNNNGFIQNTLPLSTTASEIKFVDKLGYNKFTGEYKTADNQKSDVQNSPVSQMYSNAGPHFKYNDTFLSQHSTSGQNLLEICRNITCKGNDYLAQCCGSRMGGLGKCQGEDFSYLHPIPGDATTTSQKPCKECHPQNNRTLLSLNYVGNGDASTGEGTNNLSVRVTRENSMNDFIKFQLMHGITAPDGKDLMNALKEAKYQMEKVSKEFHSDPDSNIAAVSKQSPIIQNQILPNFSTKNSPSSVIDANKILENLRTTMTDSFIHSKMRRTPIQIDRFRPTRNQGLIDNRDGIQETSLLNKLKAETNAELQRIFDLERRHKQEEESFNREREENLKELKGIKELISKEYESHKSPDLKRRDILSLPAYFPTMNNEEYINNHDTYSKLVNGIENSDSNKSKKYFIFDRYSEIKSNSSEDLKPQSEPVGVLLGDNTFPELVSQTSNENNENFPSLDNSNPHKDNIRLKREELKEKITKFNSVNPSEYIKPKKYDNLAQYFDTLHSDLFDLQRFVASRIIDKESSPREVKLANPNKHNNASYYLMDS